MGSEKVSTSYVRLCTGFLGVTCSAHTMHGQHLWQAASPPAARWFGGAMVVLFNSGLGRVASYR